MSPSHLLLPKPPESVHLFRGDFDDWLQAELVAAERRGHERALGTEGRLIQEAAKQVDLAREEAERETASFAARFAEGIAKQLLHIELDAGKHEIQKMVRETLSQSGVGRGACEVHLHPKDAETLASITFRTGTTITADPGVTRGSVHVTTAHGLLVREIDQCIKHAAEKIHTHMRRHETNGSKSRQDGPVSDA